MTAEAWISSMVSGLRELFLVSDRTRSLMAIDAFLEVARLASERAG